jgi:hypothetical protein
LTPILGALFVLPYFWRPSFERREAARINLLIQVCHSEMQGSIEAKPFHQPSYTFGKEQFLLFISLLLSSLLFFSSSSSRSVVFGLGDQSQWLPDGIFSNQKSQLGQFLECLAM